MQMDFKRLILAVVFAFSIILLWERWVQHNTPAAVPETAQSAAAADSSIPAPMASTEPGTTVPAGTAATLSAYAEAPRVTVRTDMMEAVVSAVGGDLIHVELTHHKDSEDHSKNFVVLQESGKHQYIANTGLLGAEGLPTHKTILEPEQTGYVLKDGENSLVVRLKAPASAGIEVTKLLTFYRGSYVVDVAYEINNTSDKPLNATAYFQLARDGQPAEHTKGFFGGVSTFTGPAFFTQEGKFQKVEFKKIENNETSFVKSAKDGWVAMVQHYFVSAWLPNGDVQREFYTHKISNDFYGAGVKLPVQVAAGAKQSIDVPLYVGPQEQDKLAKLATGFNKVVDYGLVTIFAEPLFWVLNMIHKIVGNWGWSIILVTILIKALFFPLSAASYKSMAKMKTLMPRMKALQERYKDDKMKLNQAMMELYKTEKVNPMGGCLPILVQMPVFIALYWVLLSVVEMRQAPWMFWITDLSVKDPYFILPLIMGATMFIQTKLNPTPPDPMQAKVMMIMPIMFTFMFLWFPSGLVLYWVVNNILSIAQQWYVTRMIERGEAKAAR